MTTTTPNIVLGEGVVARASADQRQGVVHAGVVVSDDRLLANSRERRRLMSGPVVVLSSKLEQASKVAASVVRSVDEYVLLRRAKDRIDRDFAHPLDVESIARGIGMSAGHFSRRFRDAYGEPPYSYLMTRRVERAMVLLRRGDQSVTSVCFAVGFSSLGTFSTRFSELVGVSPAAYRARDARWAAGVAPCVLKRATKPVRNREVSS